MSDNFMENVHTEFSELNDKLKILNNYIRDINKTKAEKGTEALKYERKYN